ncbi:YARHG domain-containing protein [Flavobacterium sp. H122]|uniref:YARHG domain-containing protein n=1 Tax=Flavobacterium sp. H122 TaxID=2529860 RepID=UPI0010AA5141|nr:YARHG domain-containing protein [Flavobacterium sp. H122]
MKTTRMVFLFLLLSLNLNAQVLKDCAVCSAQIVKPEKIKDLSIDEIRLLTNEIFARNGYQFENSRFQDYFEQKSWYKSKGNNKNVSFNEIEKQNIKAFQERIRLLKQNQEELINQLKAFKELVLSGELNGLKSKYAFMYEKQNQADEAKSLKEVLNRINLDDVNYYKNKGQNSVIADNGFVKIVYKLSIEGDQINLFYSFMNHSEIIEDLNEFTDYHSEDEFMYNWQFEYKSNKLKFIRLAFAG